VAGKNLAKDAKEAKTQRTEDRRARQELAGIPDSKPFIAPDGSFTRESTLPDGLTFDDLTVAGMPMASLPEEAQARLLFQQTDQGQIWWERNRRKLENIENQAPVSRGAKMFTGGEATDPAEKAILQYRDDEIHGVPLEARLAREGIKHTGRLVNKNADPFGIIMEKFVPVGYSGLMMSNKKCATEGMVRGAVEYVPFLDDVGNRVTAGDMFLGIAPTDVVNEAKRGYEAEDRARKRQSVERVREDQDRIITDSKLGRIARKNRAGGDFEGLADDDIGPEMASSHRFVG
jgi:hypothetical protein